MRNRLIFSVLLVIVILISFSGVVSAQPEGVPYVPPPIPPVDVDDVDPVTPAPPVDVPAMPATAGGILEGYGMLIGLMLLASALPLRRK